MFSFWGCCEKQIGDRKFKRLNQLEDLVDESNWEISTGKSQLGNLNWEISRANPIGKSEEGILGEFLCRNMFIQNLGGCCTTCSVPLYFLTLNQFVPFQFALFQASNRSCFFRGILRNFGDRPCILPLRFSLTGLKSNIHSL